VALLAAAVDVGVAVVRAVRSPPRVVGRGTGRAVDEPRPFAESAQIVLAWTTVIGGRVLSRSTRASRGLERLTVAHGERMDQPATSDDIDRFIAAYSIDVSLLDRHPHEFATINEFFARPLRAGARPVAHADDWTVAVSPADCRLTCVEAGDEGTRLAVKGRAYDIAGLLGAVDRSRGAPAHAFDRVRDFYDTAAADGFAVFRCRLAPGDYHRFHWPVDGLWDRDLVLDIPGEYHSVSSRAVAGPVDVLGRNRRCVAIVESNPFGSVAFVAIGAVKVGSIELTAPSGIVTKGQEMGRFRYGGSTVVLVFRRGAIRFDDELLANSGAGVETLVEVGSIIGRATPPSSPGA
jgi:phosphatidylserine decarboxylase